MLCGMHATTQEIVIGVLNRLPQDASLEQVARELEFIAGVREGFAQLDRGEGIPLDEVERLLPTRTQTIPQAASK
jgi:predicted transcriptional regulator